MMCSMNSKKITSTLGEAKLKEREKIIYIYMYVVDELEVKLIG